MPKKLTGEECPVRISADNVILQGDLCLPSETQGLVVFAHGSGSSRKSTRNRFVAQVLRDAGLGTFLFDLLTAEEEIKDDLTGELRFDIDLLARRLIAVTDWLEQDKRTGKLAIGYFGASTGAAAAIIAAAQNPDVIKAVVSRGGRVDLAQKYLRLVKAPTLLIVGGNDYTVVSLNRQAFAELKAEKQIGIIPGASHLFEEPGTLEKVARHAADWFVKYLRNSDYRKMKTE